MLDFQFKSEGEKGNFLNWWILTIKSSQRGSVGISGIFNKSKLWWKSKWHWQLEISNVISSPVTPDLQVDSLSLSHRGMFTCGFTCFFTCGFTCLLVVNMGSHPMFASEWKWCVIIVDRRYGFDPWVRKIPWRRKWHPTPVFLPGKCHGQRSLGGYSPRGHKESDTT